MGLRGLFERKDDSDLESEREALRRQRAEAAQELAGLKRTLAERVAAVQQRERELAAATARVERMERKLEKRRGLLRLKPAEAKQDEPANLDVKVDAKLDALRAELAAREDAISAREATLAEKEAELERHARESPEEVFELPEQVFELPPPEHDDDESEAIAALLAELHEAEEAFARTHAELARRSDELAEREAAVAARERTFTVQPVPDAEEIEALEARIRLLERDGGRKRKAEPPSFSAGLRALEERGLRR